MKTVFKIVVVLLILLFTFGCQEDEQLKLEAENIEIVKKYWEAWNTQDIEVFKELYDHDNYFYSRDFENPNPRNYEDTIDNIEWNFEFSSDMRNEVVNIIASDDKVISMAVFKGTYTNDMEGLPPANGQEYNISLINVMKIFDGKVIEEWEFYDMLRFYEPIGYELKMKE